ncbi:MAG: patatin-like phospholipase family protein [Chloroflexi bacterium]|nr:patatin-like phospholipase family protein [Chloroflexota bacterium]
MATAVRGKIGYALGGGGARGMSHIGVIKVLEEHGLFPEVIAGTSIGALVGALYAWGLKTSEIEQWALGVDWKRMALLVDPGLSVSGLIHGKRITSMLKSLLGDVTFSDLKLGFACVATDILNGQEVVLDSGPVIKAVRASISVPGILTPVKVGGRYLVDGGLVNEVPVSTCRHMGAEYVVGVNVVPGPGDMQQESKSKRPPTLVKVLSQSLLIAGHRAAMQNMEDADLAISPAVGRIGFFQFDKAAEAIAAGEEAARHALDQAGIPHG